MKTGKSKKPQRDEFIEAARAAGCDEDEKRFDVRLKKIIKGKRPEPRKPGK
jgi:hypothetical protein